MAKLAYTKAKAIPAEQTIQRNRAASPQARMASPITGRSVGIDLGSSYARMGVWQNGRVEIATDALGETVTPLYVSFTVVGQLVGAAAKAQLATNAANTVFDIMRLIGHKFDDPEVQKGMEEWPFQVIRGPDDEPLVVVQFLGERKTYRPEEILVMMLTELRQVAETCVGESVKNVVLAVPSSYNSWQRGATKDAAAMAGLKVLRVMNNTSAAAISYGLHKKGAVRNVLVFALGSGSFDVSLVSVEEGIFEVIATTGDQQMGQTAFENRLADHFAAEIRRKYRVDMRTDSRARWRLRDTCERIKRTLSTATQATVAIDSMVNGVDVHLAIKRTRFEDMCADLFRKAISLAEKVLRDAKFAKGRVDEVVLVGDSTPIPKLKQQLSEFMNGKQSITPSTADEAVTFGATVHAAILSGNQDPTLKDVLLLDATLLSLGVKTADGMVTTVISRNTSTPTKKSQTFSTDTDNQTSVLIEVFEGERSMSYDHRLLGKLYLEDIPPMPRGEPQIDVSFDIDADGTLRVTADEKSTGKTNAITLKGIKDGILPASTAAKVTGQEYRVIRWHKSAHAPVVSDTETPWSVVTPPSAGEIDHDAPSTRGSQATSFDRPPPSERKRKRQQTGAEDPSIRVKQQKMKAAQKPTEATGGMPQALAAASSAQPVAPTAVPTAHLPVPTPPVVAETADHQTGVDRLVRTRATVGEVMNANSDAPSTSSAVGTSTPSEEEKHQDPPEQHSDNAGSTVWIGGTPLLQSVEVHLLRLVASVNRWRRRTDLPGGEEGSTTSSTSRPATNTSTNDTLRAELEKLRQSIATLQEDLHVATDWIVAHVTNHSGATQLVGDLGISSFTASAGEDLLLMRSVEVDLLRLVTAVQRQLLATGIAESDSGPTSNQSHGATEQVPATSASRREVETLALSIRQLQGDLQMAITALSVRLEQQLAQAQAEKASNGDDTDTEDEYVKQETAPDGE